MKTNGFKLLAALAEWKGRRELLQARFADSVYVFPKEKKDNPKAIMEELHAAEDKISEIQAAQVRFNMSVKVPVRGTKGDITLLEAVKRVGAADRISQLWKGLVKEEKDPYTRRSESRTRDKDAVIAVAQVPKAEATELFTKASSFARALREAIQTGNSKEVEIDIDLNLD